MKAILTDINFKKPPVTELKSNLYRDKHIHVSMLRLDEIHPIISGNKLFKLYYFLDEASNSSHKKIITFGGAFSNHLAATAFACKEMNLKSMGIVRGEKPVRLSHTMQFCLDHGMELQFVSREDYKRINEKDFLEGLKKQYGECILIPEGGFSIKGKVGASLITETFDNNNYTHVCVAVGTATTFAGIIDGSKTECEVIGFSVLKNMQDIHRRLVTLRVSASEKYSFITDYHFGGYAKKTDELISFMNEFYVENNIPLDFVYTAKMMFGINDLAKKNYFLPGSNILCIHTGGLQGNQSLPGGTLVF
jgi:1-aminocyclopropane-1-carboxylate deaminase/D-cysteine desulfhydrase-like pyridoxal-dependent ACC family enzyme